MNSKSKSLRCNQCGCNPCKCNDRCNDKSCCHEHRWDCDIECCNTCHCVPGHPLPSQSIMSCGTGTGLNIPAVAPGTSFNPVPVASVTIDTTCLCNPGIKIDFSSIINYQALLDLGAGPLLTTPFTVTFQLSKTCNDGSKIPLGSWTFTIGILAVAVNITETFSFTFCECHACPGCCVYTVDIVQALRSALAGTVAVTSETASIVTSSLTAIAASSC
ncbi:DUF4489 domain-containing protein [Clostridium faecium]|uniref:DUF4489 domain-containing protein n=1 Tax=Clostridium faecium TaxID=2762223 RepID=A0ABR8YRD2_9CLOT|nr:DUF4489 domain-containing protein [Clostridium faecium]MBD8046568.1 DUF4489 domain-containing protein [Clostridium faecium]